MMKKYVCPLCGYIYDPDEGDLDEGIKPGTLFEELPDGWCCPVCSASIVDLIPRPALPKILRKIPDISKNSTIFDKSG